MVYDFCVYGIYCQLYLINVVGVNLVIFDVIICCSIPWKYTWTSRAISDGEEFRRLLPYSRTPLSAVSPSVGSFSKRRYSGGVLYMLRIETRGAPGEFPLHECPHLAMRRRWATGWGVAPRVWASSKAT